MSQSQVGAYVSVVAPGSGVVAAAPGHGLGRYDGTSFAAPFVAATAALIRQYHPGIRAPEVIARILATTDPAPGNRPSPAYGYGILNPYRAVTEQPVPASGIGAAFQMAAATQPYSAVEPMTPLRFDQLAPEEQPDTTAITAAFPSFLAPGQTEVVLSPQ